jgi:putative phosphoesterase
MRIGILSDTHNDSDATRQALAEFRQRGVTMLFHCGDLTTAEMVKLFDGFDVRLVRGNMDRHFVKALKAAVAAQPGGRWLGKGDLVEMDGKLIAVTHGDREDVFESLLFSEPDYLLHGHTHRRRDERVGPTRVINPGAVGGMQHEARSICILDLRTDHLDVIHL